ncbi:MAG: 30S ribosome-binding factor RbfA [Clostridiales bacterium]|nr:30S ribosome-binding factor RbfA [Clostridiales bacterium]
MKKVRSDLVGDELRKIISDVIMNKLKDPRIPLLTSVTEVKVSSDLSHATCFISVYGDDQVKDDAMRAINHAAGFIRREVAANMRLRVTPELHFKLDKSLEEAAAIGKRIDEVIAEDERRARERQKNEQDQE